jgi:hypothetical protein
MVRNGKLFGFCRMLHNYMTPPFPYYKPPFLFQYSEKFVVFYKYKSNKFITYIQMSNFSYLLELYEGMNTRYRYPVCQQKEKTFSRYIDTQTGQYLAPTVGRCNREMKCGYHHTPKQYFKDNNISSDTIQAKPYNKPKSVTPQQKPVSFIQVETFKASLGNHEPNHFIKFLLNLFPVDIVKSLISAYFIGTAKYWPGATVFWQIDLSGRIRTGKIMLYDAYTGKRVKKPFNPYCLGT